MSYDYKGYEHKHYNYTTKTNESYKKENSEIKIKETSNEIMSRTSEASKFIFSNNQSIPNLDIKELKSEKINTHVNTHSHNSENNTVSISLISKKNIPISNTEEILESPSHESEIRKEEELDKVNQNHGSAGDISKYSSMSEYQLTEALDDLNTPNEDIIIILNLLNEMDEKACNVLNEEKSNIEQKIKYKENIEKTNENIEKTNENIEKTNENIEKTNENIEKTNENIEKINEIKTIESKEYIEKLDGIRNFQSFSPKNRRFEIFTKDKFNRKTDFNGHIDHKTGFLKIPKNLARYFHAGQIISKEIEKGVFKEVLITEIKILDDEEIEKMKNEYIKYYALIYPTQKEKKSDDELDFISKNFNLNKETRDSEINGNSTDFNQKIKTYSFSEIDFINKKTTKEINEERIKNSEKEMDLKEEKIKKIVNDFYMEMNEIKGTNLLEDILKFDEKLSQLKVDIFKENNIYKGDLKKLIENKKSMKIPLQTLRKFNQFSISTIKEIKNILNYSNSKKMVVLQTLEELLKTKKEASSIIKGFLSEAGIENVIENLGNYGKTV